MAISVELEIGYRRSVKLEVVAMTVGTSFATPRTLHETVQSVAAKRQYEPITLRTSAAPGSSLLIRSVMGLTLPTIKLNFYRLDPSGSGTTQLYYVMVLIDAVIARHTQNVLPVQMNKESARRWMEEFVITFQRIEWHVISGGSTDSDDWSGAA